MLRSFRFNVARQHRSRAARVKPNRYGTKGNEVARLRYRTTPGPDEAANRASTDFTDYADFGAEDTEKETKVFHREVREDRDFPEGRDGAVRRPS